MILDGWLQDCTDIIKQAISPVHGWVCANVTCMWCFLTGNMINMLNRTVWSCPFHGTAISTELVWDGCRSMPSSKWIVPVVLHLWTRYAPWEFHLYCHSFCVFSDLCAGVPDISLSCPAKCGKMLSFQLSSTSWVLFYLFGFKLSRSGLLVMWISLLPLLWVLSCIWIRTCRTRATTAPIRGEQRGAMLWLPLFTINIRKNCCQVLWKPEKNDTFCLVAEDCTDYSISWNKIHGLFMIVWFPCNTLG